jgi:hypothetical protein
MRRFGDGICLAEVQTLPTWISLQDVYRPLCTEIPSEQASVGGRICRWLLLFQEYDFEVIVKPGNFNSGPDHLSHILSGEDAGNLDDSLPDAHLFAIQMVDDYFAEIVQFFSTGVAPSDFTVAQKKKLVVKATDYQLIAGNLYKLGTDDIL